MAIALGIRKARNATYSDSSDDAYLADRVMDSIKAIPATKDDKDETDQAEKHSKKRYHHKHSKRETHHHHKSRRKDKKHSSSSKHKRKHKRKSSSHRSKEHKRKDHCKVESNRVLVKVERGGEDSNNKSESTKDEAKNEDSDSSTPADTVDEDSDIEVGSVSPPNRLAKEDLIEKDPLHNSNECSNGSPRNADPIVKKDESSLKYDKAEDKLNTLEKQQSDDTVEKKCNQTLLHKSCDLILHPSHRENHQKREQCHNTSSKMVKDEVIPNNKFQSADRGGLNVRESDEKLKLSDKGLSKTSKSSTKDDGEGLTIGLGNQRATSDLQTGKVGNIREETSVSSSSPSKEDSNIKAENKSQESYLELDKIKKDKDTLSKLQNKQKVIKINIKTLELPTDALLTAEDKAKDEENGDSNTSEDEDGEDNNGSDDAASPGRLPWRIVPEEGELSPSTASDGGEQSKVETMSKVTDEEVETTSKVTDEKVETTTSKVTEKSKEEIKDKDGRHKHSKKRGHDEGGKMEKSRLRERNRGIKMERQDKRSESSYKGYTVRSVKDRLGVRQKSNSPDRKTVRSSVVVRDKKSLRRYPDHSRSRSKSPAQRRSRSRSPHSSRYSSRRGRSDRSRSRSPGYGQRANSPHGRRNHSYQDKRTDSRDRKRDRSRSGSRERRRRRRERSYTPVEEIDKKKLFEFAKANAYLYQKVLSGDLPATTRLPQLKSKVVSLSGGKTVDELTEVCKGLSKVDGEDSSDEEPLHVPVTSDDERDSFIRHPFLVKEEPTSIVLNIQNAIPIPVQNSKEKLRVQFPVSSGTQHRKKEESTATGPFGEWEPVKKPKPVSATPGPSNKSPAPPVVPPPGGTPPSTSSSSGVSLPVATPSLPTPLLPAVPAPTLPPVPVPVEDRVFDETPADNVNIADVVAMRLKAARQLQSNPLDIEALSSMHRAQHRLQNWVNKESKPGLFTGRTDANILTPLQLANPNRKNQAWAKKKKHRLNEMIECKAMISRNIFTLEPQSLSNRSFPEHSSKVWKGKKLDRSYGGGTGFNSMEKRTKSFQERKFIICENLEAFPDIFIVLPCVKTERCH
ncbi:hypothetical protein BSL78_16183 [Apostichopus japonicus]|uniref:Protein SON n=1 Tax=Stichopus japonicus TaxID=307972 RepID=A0A2G8KG25_STIJA|nr:hypothetical protein BSL78_16183 [Apostichopus japonicus]